jgi:hypothetical protein
MWCRRDLYLGPASSGGAFSFLWTPPEARDSISVGRSLPGGALLTNQLAPPRARFFLCAERDQQQQAAIAMKALQSQEESPASFDAGRRGVNKRVPKSSPQEISVRDLSKGL